MSQQSAVKQLSYRFEKISYAEILSLAVILFTFLLIGLLQAARLTDLDPWPDHMMFVDPAANLYFGNGFTSTEWFAQRSDEFWAGYPPLYAILLYGWMLLFGFGLHTARSLNCALIVVSAILLWQAVIRLNLVTSISNRLLLVTILLLQLGYISNSEPGRPDILMASLAIASFLAYSIKATPLRLALMGVLGVLFPLSGLAQCNSSGVDEKVRVSSVALQVS